MPLRQVGKLLTDGVAGADVKDEAGNAKAAQRCGLCRGFRAETGECRMGYPQVFPETVFGFTISYGTRWPQPELGADDSGCEQFSEKVDR